MNDLLVAKMNKLILILFLFIGSNSTGQEIDSSLFRGTWTFLNVTDKKGDPTFPGIQEALRSGLKYYLILSENGEFSKDVVSLIKGYAGNTMRGVWFYNEKRKSISFTHFNEKDENYNKPIEFKIIELTKHTLIYYDSFHETNIIHAR